MEGTSQTNLEAEAEYPCAICKKECTWSQQSILCDDCEQWLHAECLGYSVRDYEQLGKSDELWSCPWCEKKTNISKKYSLEMKEKKRSRGFVKAEPKVQTRPQRNIGVQVDMEDAEVDGDGPASIISSQAVTCSPVATSSADSHLNTSSQILSQQSHASAVSSHSADLESAVSLHGSSIPAKKKQKRKGEGSKNFTVKKEAKRLNKGSKQESRNKKESGNRILARNVSVPADNYSGERSVWSKLGVLKCSKCGLITSDEALFQFHVCGLKRPTQRTPLNQSKFPVRSSESYSADAGPVVVGIPAGSASSSPSIKSSSVVSSTCLRVTNVSQSGHSKAELLVTSSQSTAQSYQPPKVKLAMLTLKSDETSSTRAKSFEQSSRKFILRKAVTLVSSPTIHSNQLPTPDIGQPGAISLLSSSQFARKSSAPESEQQRAGLPVSSSQPAVQSNWPCAIMPQSSAPEIVQPRDSLPVSSVVQLNQSTPETLQPRLVLQISSSQPVVQSDQLSTLKTGQPGAEVPVSSSHPAVQSDQSSTLKTGQPGAAVPVSSSQPAVQSDQSSTLKTGQPGAAVPVSSSQPAVQSDQSTLKTGQPGAEVPVSSSQPAGQSDQSSALKTGQLRAAVPVSSSQPAVQSDQSSTLKTGQPRAAVPVSSSQPVVQSDQSSTLKTGQLRAAVPVSSSQPAVQSGPRDVDKTEQKHGYIKFDENTEKFVCMQCKFSAVEGNSLIEHLIFQLFVTPYCCPHCMQSFPTRPLFQKHFAAVHPGSKIKCELHNVKDVKKLLRRAKVAARSGGMETFVLHPKFTSCIKHLSALASSTTVPQVSVVLSVKSQIPAIVKPESDRRTFPELETDEINCSSSVTGHGLKTSVDVTGCLLESRRDSRGLESNHSSDLTINQSSESFRNDGSSTAVVDCMVSSDVVSSINTPLVSITPVLKSQANTGKTNVSQNQTMTMEGTGQSMIKSQMVNIPIENNQVSSAAMVTESSGENPVVVDYHLSASISGILAREDVAGDSGTFPVHSQANHSISRATEASHFPETDDAEKSGELDHSRFSLVQLSPLYVGECGTRLSASCIEMQTASNEQCFQADPEPATHSLNCNDSAEKEQTIQQDLAALHLQYPTQHAVCIAPVLGNSEQASSVQYPCTSGFEAGSMSSAADSDNSQYFRLCSEACVEQPERSQQKYCTQPGMTSLKDSMQHNFPSAQYSHSGPSGTLLNMPGIRTTVPTTPTSSDVGNFDSASSRPMTVLETSADVHRPYSSISPYPARSPVYTTISPPSSPMHNSSREIYSPISPAPAPAVVLGDCDHAMDQSVTEQPGPHDLTKQSHAECADGPANSFSSQPSAVPSTNTGCKPAFTSFAVPVSLEMEENSAQALPSMSVAVPSVSQALPDGSCSSSLSMYLVKYHSSYACLLCGKRFAGMDTFYDHVWSHFHPGEERCCECSNITEKACLKTRQTVDSVSSILNRTVLSMLNDDWQKKLSSKLAGKDIAVEREADSPDSTVHAQPLSSGNAIEVQTPENVSCDSSDSSHKPESPSTTSCLTKEFPSIESVQKEGEVTQDAEQTTRHSPLPHPLLSARESDAEEMTRVTREAMSAYEAESEESGFVQPDPIDQEVHSSSSSSPPDITENDPDFGPEPREGNSPDVHHLGGDEEAEIQPEGGADFSDHGASCKKWIENTSGKPHRPASVPRTENTDWEPSRSASVPRTENADWEPNTHASVPRTETTDWEPSRSASVPRMENTDCEPSRSAIVPRMENTDWERRRLSKTFTVDYEPRRPASVPETLSTDCQPRGASSILRTGSLDCEQSWVSSPTLELEQSSQGGSDTSEYGSAFYICSLCKFSCITAVDFTIHLNSNHHSATTFPCYYCNYSGAYTTDLTNHMSGHTSGESKIFRCPCFWDGCSYRNDSLYSMSQHLEKHENYKTYKCFSCGSAFADCKQFLQHSDQNSITLYTCTLCGSRFVEKAAIQHHWRTEHSGGLVFRVLKLLLCNERKANGYHLCQWSTYKMSSVSHDFCSDSDRPPTLQVPDFGSTSVPVSEISDPVFETEITSVSAEIRDTSVPVSETDNTDALVSETVNISAPLCETVNTSALVSETVNTSAIVSETENMSATMSETVNTSAIVSETENMSATVSETANTSAIVSETENISATVSETANTSALVSETENISATVSETVNTSALVSETEETSASVSDTEIKSVPVPEAEITSVPASDSENTLFESVSETNNISVPVLEIEKATSVKPTDKTNVAKSASDDILIAYSHSDDFLSDRKTPEPALNIEAGNKSVDGKNQKDSSSQDIAKDAKSFPKSSENDKDLGFMPAENEFNLIKLSVDDNNDKVEERCVVLTGSDGAESCPILQFESKADSSEQNRNRSYFALDEDQLLPATHLHISGCGIQSKALDYDQGAQHPLEERLSNDQDRSHHSVTSMQAGSVLSDGGNTAGLENHKGSIVVEHSDCTLQTMALSSVLPGSGGEYLAAEADDKDTSVTTEDSLTVSVIDREQKIRLSDLFGSEELHNVLSVHLYHANADQFCCTICDRNFRQYKRIHEHLFTHYHVPLYSCFFCSYKCGLKSEMKSHISAQHPHKRGQSNSLMVCRDQLLTSLEQVKPLTIQRFKAICYKLKGVNEDPNEGLQSDQIARAGSISVDGEEAVTIRQADGSEEAATGMMCIESTVAGVMHDSCVSHKGGDPKHTDSSLGGIDSSGITNNVNGEVETICQHVSPVCTDNISKKSLVAGVTVSQSGTEASSFASEAVVSQPSDRPERCGVQSFNWSTYQRSVGENRLSDSGEHISSPVNYSRKIHAPAVEPHFSSQYMPKTAQKKTEVRGKSLQCSTDRVVCKACGLMTLTADGMSTHLQTCSHYISTVSDSEETDCAESLVRQKRTDNSSSTLLCMQTSGTLSKTEFDPSEKHVRESSDSVDHNQLEQPIQPRKSCKRGSEGSFYEKVGTYCIPPSKKSKLSKECHETTLTKTEDAKILGETVSCGSNKTRCKVRRLQHRVQKDYEEITGVEENQTSSAVGGGCANSAKKEGFGEMNGKDDAPLQKTRKRRAVLCLDSSSDDDTVQNQGFSKRDIEMETEGTVTVEEHILRCIYCSFIASSSHTKELQDHLHTEHKSLVTSLFRCGYCDQLYGCLEILKRHTSKIHPGQPHLQEQVPYTYYFTVQGKRNCSPKQQLQQVNKVKSVSQVKQKKVCKEGDLVIEDDAIESSGSDTVIELSDGENEKSYESDSVVVLQDADINSGMVSQPGTSDKESPAVTSVDIIGNISDVTQMKSTDKCPSKQNEMITPSSLHDNDTSHQNQNITEAEHRTNKEECINGKKFPFLDVEEFMVLQTSKDIPVSEVSSGIMDNSKTESVESRKTAFSESERTDSTEPGISGTQDVVFIKSLEKEACADDGKSNKSTMERYLCVICTQPHSDYRSIFLHLSHHLNHSPFRCSLCQLELVSSSEMQLHYAQDHPGKPFSQAGWVYDPAVEKQLAALIRASKVKASDSGPQILKENQSVVKDNQGMRVAQECEEYEKSAGEKESGKEKDTVTVRNGKEFQQCIQCSLCQIVLDSPSQLKTHYLKDHGVTNDSRNMKWRDIPSQNLYDLGGIGIHYEHTYQFERFKYLCGFCSWRFDNRQTVLTHAREKHSDMRWYIMLRSDIPKLITEDPKRPVAATTSHEKAKEIPVCSSPSVHVKDGLQILSASSNGSKGSAEQKTAGTGDSCEKEGCVQLKSASNNGPNGTAEHKRAGTGDSCEGESCVQLKSASNNGPKGTSEQKTAGTGDSCEGESSVQLKSKPVVFLKDFLKAEQIHELQTLLESNGISSLCFGKSLSAETKSLLMQFAPSSES